MLPSLGHELTAFHRRSTVNTVRSAVYLSQAITYGPMVNGHGQFSIKLTE